MNSFEPTNEQIEAAVAAFNKRSWEALAHETFEVTDVHAMAAALRAAFALEPSLTHQPQPAGEEPTGSTSAPHPVGTNK